LAYKLDSKGNLDIVDESIENLEYFVKSKSQCNIGENSRSSHNLLLNDVPNSAKNDVDEFDSFENRTLH
jgi:hypothetical protein